jgi:cobalt-zinc-cadmium efflux system outer membrane protein
VPDHSIPQHVLRLLFVFAFASSTAGAQVTIGGALPPSNEVPSLTIERAIRSALATNPRLGAAREMVSAAKGTRVTARSWTNPSFTYQTEEMDVAGAHGTATTAREAMWTAMLPLEPIYQLGSRAARANAELFAAEADFRSARREIALRAVSGYYATALAQVSVNGFQEIGTWLDSLVAYTRARVREGAAAEVDLIRLQVEQDRAGTDLAIASADLARLRAQLTAVIGTDSFDLDPVVATKLPAGFTNAGAVDAAIMQATTHRPELVAADARLKAAAAGVSLEQRSVLRELGVMGGVKRMLGDASLVAGLSMPLPIFDRNRGEIQRARAEQRIATFDRESTRRQVVAEVRSAYSAVTMLDSQVARIDGSMLQRAEESRRIAEGAYREGATSLTQVLDAARALVDARESYYRAVFARNQGLIELNAAIGSENLLTMPSGGVR